MRHIDFMSRTINDFMEFNKAGKSKEPFNVAETVMGSISIIQGTLTNNRVDLQTEGLEGSGLQTYGAASELKQVVVNLLGNAKDAVIAANEQETAPRWIRLTLQEEPDAAVLIFEDNGGGIPDEIMDRIFEPYFTTKGEVQGTGIGLYMSKMIVEQSMSGSMSVENREAGACFTVRLPKYEG
jgi:C4-dicarboxylate-specific signal transduction histidine kinase